MKNETLAVTHEHGTTLARGAGVENVVIPGGSNASALPGTAVALAADQSYAGHNLVFIVGAPRSGTTWLQRLLAAHPAVRTGQESKLFRSYLSPLVRSWQWEFSREEDRRTATGRGGTGMSCYLKQDEFLAIVRDCMRRMLEPMIGRLAPGELFVEKTPQHALCLDEIRLLLPESRVLHVLRDPRDVVASMLSASRSWGAGWAPRRAEVAARDWVGHVRAARRAADRLESGRYFEIRYEELWRSPVDRLAATTDFLGLAWSREEIAAAVADNSADLVRAGGGTPIPLSGERAGRGGVVRDPSAFVRRATPGGWKTDLTLWEKLQVWRIARRLMGDVGYAW